MEENQIDKSALDTDYEQDSWFGQKEVSFSSKILAVAGGITSFGGLFPVLLDKVSSLSGNGAGVWFFVLFTIMYFAAPLLLFVVWTWISDRIAFPDRPLKIISGWNFAAWVDSPISYRFQWLIFIQSVVIIVYLVFSIGVLGGVEKLNLLVLSCPLLITPLVALYAFTKRRYEGQKITQPKLIFGFMVVVVGASVFLYLSSDKHNHKTDRADYKKLVEVDRITKSLDSLDRFISNKVDRF